MTNVFISWSGQTSKKIAEELRQWIPSTLQFAKPYFTPDDIEKGSKWGSEISKQLAETNVGIVCLTRDNHTKPWILFEAGALSKDLDSSKVCSVLFGMENTDLTGPLTTFQTTAFEKSDFRKLMSTINDAGGERKLASDTFNSVFEMWWPKLENKISEILRTADNNEEKEIRTDRDILEEILSINRNALRSSRGVIRSAIPSKFVSHFIETLEEIVACYEKSEDPQLFGAIKEQFEQLDYLIARSEGNEEQLSSRSGTLKLRFDNIIPF